ncbi:HD-GYP domain-containing protein [Fusibacter ferrireducens]|uniref:HD-GYP domain-containing protein n=1 Tax=Fusibacter ferrireducens TaxID=2785058 RepID=A0ABR9ZV40_9FIRM|nr:HD-GYP domain-containing protein [Fusibacter ferrireducens]MBF4693841.1 HD-GYP domain-containing protein [Fusibacter ferrireducens]
MRLKSIERVEPGDKLGKAVYDDKCQLLLARGVNLTFKYIERLKQASIHCVYIEDYLSEGLEFENVIPDEIKVRSITAVKNVFKEVTERKGVSLSTRGVDAIKDIVDQMMDMIFQNRDTLYVMTELMGTDMYTYNHSAEVAILSMLVAKSLGLNGQYIQKVGIGAMLHDIGKMKIPNEVLNKRDPLTPSELDQVREHAKLGYELLKDSDAVSPISRQIVLLHHEKMDGKGYPMMLDSDDIPVHVRIVTICDIFNALVSNRSYREKMNIDMALEIIRTEAVYQLDREIYYHLIKVVNIYPVGTVVELSNGKMGIVIKENKDAQTRPIVQVIKDKKKAEILNLLNDLTLFISKTIEL